MFVVMQEFVELKTRSQRENIQMPIPIGKISPKANEETHLIISFHFHIVFHACFDEDNKSKNHLVMENLRDQVWKVFLKKTLTLNLALAAKFLGL